jgi:hypothetical protein
MAGWDPGQTYWLADVLALSGPAAHWVERDDGWVHTRSGRSGT